MNERQEQLRDEFQREVEIVRGAGGFAPTTDDLRAHGEAMAWAALSESSLHPIYDEAELAAMRVEDSEHHLAYLFAERHIDPEARALVRVAIGCLRDDREALAKLDK